MARCHSSFELQPLSGWCQLLRIVHHVKCFIWSCVTCRCTRIWNWTIHSMRKDTLPHSARLSPIIMWRHDSAQWRESQGERGEWSWWPITATCMWNKGSPVVPICYSWHAHIGCKQPNELSYPVEICGHVHSIGRWKLISVPAPAKNNW
jgi:hypothetical protein